MVIFLGQNLVTCLFFSCFQQSMKYISLQNRFILLRRAEQETYQRHELLIQQKIVRIILNLSKSFIKFKVFYCLDNYHIHYVHFEIIDDPCNMIGSRWLDLLTNRTILCS